MVLLNKNITDKGYNNLKTFGAGKDLKAVEWADYIMQMLNMGVMDIAYDEGHTYKLNAISWQVIKEGKTIMLSRYLPLEQRKVIAEKEIPKVKSPKEIVNEELINELKSVRKQLAQQNNVPAYIIFNDATLMEMASKKPINKEAMLEISGIGLQKFDLYGKIFMKIIEDLINNKNFSSKALGIDTADLTFHLYEKGMSLEEMAAIRQLTTGSIYTHLIKLDQLGKEIDFAKFLTFGERQEITDAFERLNWKKRRSN